MGTSAKKALALHGNNVDSACHYLLNSTMRNNNSETKERKEEKDGCRTSIKKKKKKVTFETSVNDTCFKADSKVQPTASVVKLINSMNDELTKKMKAVNAESTISGKEKKNVSFEYKNQETKNKSQRKKKKKQKNKMIKEKISNEDTQGIEHVKKVAEENKITSTPWIHLTIHKEATSVA